MEAFLYWAFLAGAALFGVAVIVAWWEQLGGPGEPQRLAEPGEAPPRPVNVDVELDALAASPAHAAGDAQTRRDALDGALGRMSQAAAARRSGWTDTAPSVGPGLRGEAPKDPTAARDKTSSSSH